MSGKYVVYCMVYALCSMLYILSFTVQSINNHNKITTTVLLLHRRPDDPQGHLCPDDFQRLIGSLDSQRSNGSDDFQSSHGHDSVDFQSSPGSVDDYQSRSYSLVDSLTRPATF